MPIYAYRCETCGFQQDVLQKMSDARLTVCPSCGNPTFQKQVTAAGFQLKGSGWYVTDFRGGDATGKPAPELGGDAGKADAKPGDAGSGDAAKKTDAAPAPSPAAASPSSSAAAPAASSPSPAAAPPSGKGGS